MKNTTIAKVKMEEQEKSVEKAIVKLPLMVQGRAKQALQYEQTGDYERAIEICIQLLDEENGSTYYAVRMILGRCYFAQGDPFMARMVFHDVVLDFPDEELPHLHLGFSYHMMEEYTLAIEEFEKIYPLSSYQPFFYNSYGDCLNAVGKRKQSREIFYKEIKRYEKTGDILSAEMLDGTYENVLYLDIVLGNGKYAEDLQSYYRFLDSVEMNQTMQEHLAGTIVYLCELIENIHYRPMFREFIKHVEEKGYLTMERYKKTLESAHASVESYQYHEDRNICAFVEAYLAAVYEREYTIEDMEDPEIKQEMQVKAICYEWYVCEYYLGHEEEFAYVERTYPFAWSLIKSFIYGIRKDRDAIREKVLKELYDCGNIKGSIDELRKSLEAAYIRAIVKEKEPVYIHDGSVPYERMEKKVGRNEPCPCGSGRKYKQCCGR